MRLNGHILAVSLLLILLYSLVAVPRLHWIGTWAAILVAVTILPLLYLAPWEKASPRAFYLVSLLFISLAFFLVHNTGDSESPFSLLFFILCISHGTLYSLTEALTFTTLAAGGYFLILLPGIVPLGPLSLLLAEKVIIFPPLLYLCSYLSYYLSREMRIEAAKKEEKDALAQDLVQKNVEIFAFSSITAFHHLSDLRSALLEALGKALNLLRQKEGFIVCWAEGTSNQDEPLVLHRGSIQGILPQLISLLRAKLDQEPGPSKKDFGIHSLGLDQEEQLLSFNFSSWEEKLLVYLPLASQGRALGLLGILVRDEESLSPYDRQFLQGIADQVSIVIENALYLQKHAQVFKGSPQQWQRASLLREARYLPTLSADAILKTLVDSLSSFFDVPRVGVFLLLRDRPSPYLYVAHDEFKSPPTFPYPVDLRFYPELQAAMKTGQILQIDDVAHHPLMREVRDLLLLSEISSLTLIPIHLQEETVGLISIGQRTPTRNFSQAELQLCQVLAQQAGAAIENASLYFQTLDLANEVEEEKIFRQSLIESLTSGLISLDYDGRVAFFNEAAEKILGYKREEVMGTVLSALIGEEQVKAFRLDLFKDQGVVLRQRGRWRTREGQKIAIEFTLSPHLSPRDGVLGAVISFQDVTEEDRLKEELRRVERLASLGTMAAGIAHEIRNPLANIRIAVQALEKQLPAEHPYRKSPQRIIQEIDRLNQIIHDFLAFARPPKPNRQPTELPLIIGEVISLLREQIAKGGIRVMREFFPHLPEVRVDKALMQQVFLNLFLNAIHAMPEGGEIIISIHEVSNPEKGEAGGRFLQVRLEDSGPGIPPQDLERIFDPFYTTKPHGTGLGLSVVHQILREHEGHIRVMSEPGRGATFIIDLPSLA